jgi:hypothetical protein
MPMRSLESIYSIPTMADLTIRYFGAFLMSISLRFTAKTLIGLLLVAVVTAGMVSAEASAAWKVQSTPNPTGAEYSQLNGIACPNPEECVAVGSYLNSSSVSETLAEVVDGGTWTLDLPANPTGTGRTLIGVSCPSGLLCMAAGKYINSSGKILPLIEEWANPSTWTIQTLPVPTGTTAAELGAISCASVTECMAVGDYHNGTGEHFFAELWQHGSWTALTPTEPSSGGFFGLRGVSCPKAEECMADGVYVESGIRISVSDEWKAGSWTVRSTDNPSGDTEFLMNGITCTTIKECIAVGSYTNTSDTPKKRALVEEWEGSTSTWVVQEPRNPGEPNFLDGVACPKNIKVCRSVGEVVTTPSITENLGEELGGGSWSPLTIPNPAGFKASELGGIACNSLDVCFADGSYINSSVETVTLGESN